MASIADGLLDAARENLGYREQADGYTKFGDWYFTTIDKTDPYFKKAPWCDMFITWAAHQAGVEAYVGDFASTVKHARWFKEHNAWSDTPEPGAIVFYDWGGSRDIGAIDHAGIVEAVEGAEIFTIEANVDKVWLKRKERDQTKVVGYGLPRKVQETLELGPASGAAPALPVEAASRSLTLTATDQPAVLSPQFAIPALVVTVLLSVVATCARRAYGTPATGRHRRSAEPAESTIGHRNMA